jgi:hypothetical protein
VTKRLLPSLCSLVDEDVAHRPEMFLELADRVDAAARELWSLDVRADPSGVVAFLAAFAERRGFDLPAPAMLAMDARAVAEEIPADLLALACQRLWARFRYRRLPEPPDFAEAIREELAERREAAAKVRAVTLKVETARMRERLDAAARERHARIKAAERAREEAHSATKDVVPVEGDAGRIQVDPAARHDAGYDSPVGTAPVVNDLPPIGKDDQDVPEAGNAQVGGRAGVKIGRAEDRDLNYDHEIAGGHSGVGQTGAAIDDGVGEEIGALADLDSQAAGQLFAVGAAFADSPVKRLPDAGPEADLADAPLGQGDGSSVDELVPAAARLLVRSLPELLPAYPRAQWHRHRRSPSQLIERTTGRGRGEHGRRGAVGTPPKGRRARRLSPVGWGGAAGRGRKRRYTR